MAKGETYEEFVEKFKPKKTMDDCYTPPALYNDIAEWVCREYGVDKESIIRPFWPGADYTKEDYTGRVVVDNPPFSIRKQIVDYFDKHGIPFFLFSPALLLSKSDLKYRFVIAGEDAIFENGARVSLNFVTNMGRQGCIVTSPELCEIIRKNRPKGKQLPGYRFPANVLRAWDFQYLAKNGIEMEIDHYRHISALDSQKQKGKGIFGGGVLISDEVAKKIKAAKAAASLASLKREAEGKRKQAEEARAITWALSEREQAIIDELNK